MIPLMLRFKSYLIILGILSAMFGWGMWERNGKLSIKAEYDGFVSKAQILAAERLAENQRKEVEYAQRIKDAQRSRDSAINSLRAYRERPRLSSMPGSPQTSGRTDAICWTTDQFDTGLRRLEEIIIRGQTSIEDVKLLLEAWPK